MKGSSKRKAFNTCTLKELCPDDKQKVARLVKQLVELGQENQRLKDAGDKAAAAVEDKIKQIQECNKETVRVNCSLKNKLGQAVTVLRMYHHKVQGLDAALRAMQTATYAENAAPSKQAIVPSQQEQQDICADTAIQNGFTAESGSNSSQRDGGKQQQLRQEAASAFTSAGAGPAPSGSSPSLSAAAAASRLQQQAQHLSAMISQHRSAGDTAAASPAATPCAAAVRAHAAAASCCESSAATTLAALEPCQPACSAAADMTSAPAAGADRDLLPVTPLVLPPHCSIGAREALRDLAHWQVQQGLIPLEQADDTLNKVLQFDPAVGSHGAFIVRELPEITAAAAAAGSTVELPEIVAAADSTVPARAREHLMMHDSSKSGIQPGARSEQHQWVDPAVPPLGLTYPAVYSIGSSTQGAAMNAPIRCALSRQPSGVEGLSEASPWDSPTTQQLRSLAAAFDSLAVLSPTSAAARASNSTATQAPSRSAADVPCSAASRSQAAGACSANDTRSIKVCCQAEQSVEEVAVDSVDAWQVPVVIHNEKSWSSLHGPPPIEVANPWWQAQQQSAVTGPLKDGHQQHPGQPRQQQESERQAQPEHHNQASLQAHLPQQQYAALQKQCSNQTALPVAYQPMQQWTEQQEIALQQVQPLFQHSVSPLQRQQDCQVQRQPADSLHLQHVAYQQEPALALVGHQLGQLQEPSHAQQQDQQDQAMTQQSGPLQGQQEAHHAISAGFGVPPQVPQPSTALQVQPRQYSFTRDCYAPCIPQNHAAQHAALAGEAGRVLEHFDESLVDLLMEVELLEQHQQSCKTQLQQQQQHEKRQRQSVNHWRSLHQQQCPGWWLPAAQPFLFVNEKPPVLTPQQQLQMPLQRSAVWRLDQQQQRDTTVAHHGSVHCEHPLPALWKGHQLGADCADDDVVSDILNHLD